MLGASSAAGGPNPTLFPFFFKGRIDAIFMTNLLVTIRRLSLSLDDDVNHDSLV